MGVINSCQEFSSYDLCLLFCRPADLLSRRVDVKKGVLFEVRRYLQIV